MDEAIYQFHLAPPSAPTSANLQSDKVLVVAMMYCTPG